MVILSSFHSGCSKSALLGDAEGLFKANIRGQRDMTPRPGMEGKPVAV